MEFSVKDMSKPQKVQALSFGMGGIILLIAVAAYVHVSMDLKPIAASFIIGGLVVAFLPYGLYTYFRDRKFNEMEKEFPGFLRNLSEGIKSGMSLPEAFKQAAKTNYGRLDKEVERTSNQLSWGIPFPEAMDRMANRMDGSELIRRSIYIVLQAYESGGNISETLDAIASNASLIKDAEKEKKSVLSQQVYIIYAIHFLFLAIIIVLYMLLTGFLLQMGGTGQTTEFGFGDVKNFCDPGSIAKPLCTLCPTFGLGPADEPECYYKSLFLLMLVVEGIMNGIVAGEVMQGKMSAGIKHSLIMGFFGLVLYIIAINMNLQIL